MLLVNMHVSKEVKTLFRKMRTALRVFEENTPWTNRAKLFISLVKEAVRKDSHERV